MVTYELNKTSAGGAIPIFVDGTWAQFQTYRWTNGAWQPVTVCRYNGTSWEMLGSAVGGYEEEPNEYGTAVIINNYSTEANPYGLTVVID